MTFWGLLLYYRYICPLLEAAYREKTIMKKLLGLLMLFAFAAVMAHAAEDLTANGTAKAKIIQAATLTHVTGAVLNFGTLIADADGGTSTLAAVASPEASDTGINRVTADPVSSDHFKLENMDTATTYAVSVPASVSISNGTQTMSVALTGSNGSVTDATSKDLYVGGTLTVGANQAVGQYTGDYTVTVTY